jgi:hypothetical protein
MYLASLFALAALSLAMASQASTPDDPAFLWPLHDGTYRAYEANHPMHGGELTFRKRGENVLGIFATPGGVMCYQGTLSGTTILVADVVRRQEDYATKVVTFVPVFESDRDRFHPLQFGADVDPYPNPFALLGTIPYILERDRKWLNECAKHYREPEEEPFPCGDPALVNTQLNEGPIKYLESGTVCLYNESKACTVENVFAVMLDTPGAVAPVKDIGHPQTVTDCGVLVLESIPGIAENRVRTEINYKHHLIRNYTLPGHVFYPGSVIRFVVLGDYGINVNTEGLGTEALAPKTANKIAAPAVWKHANELLRRAFFAKYGSPTITRKPPHKKR